MEKSVTIYNDEPRAGTFLIAEGFERTERPEDEDFKRCWALSNLQPLWMSENRSKNDKLEKPFQPSLKFGVRKND